MKIDLLIEGYIFDIKDMEKYKKTIIHIFINFYKTLYKTIPNHIKFNCILNQFKISKIAIYLYYL